ncbi:MAG: hypothetical protein JNL72_13760 [Flavipsychrobacter sp.]|nr:hypothetical protein [Flavipsychrobacter sp.]
MSALPGTYPVQLVCDGTETGVKTYDFNVRIKNQPVCGLLTTFNGTSDCSVNYVDTISAIVYNDESDVNTIRFANFGGRGFAVSATATCSAGTIVIPQQSINSNTTISGQGTFTSTGTITIYYTIIVGGVGTACQFTMNRFNL